MASDDRRRALLASRKQGRKLAARFFSAFAHDAAHTKPYRLYGLASSHLGRHVPRYLSKSFLASASHAIEDVLQLLLRHGLRCTYSGLNPDSFRSAVFTSTSVLMKAANAAGPRAVGTMPSDVVFPRKPGSLETSAIALASLSTIGSGVSLGAHRPYHELMKKSFSPTSAAVGMLGASGVRSLEVTKRPRARAGGARG